MKNLATTSTVLLLVIFAGITAPSCSTVSLTSTKSKPTSSELSRVATYYLPQKIIEGAVTYTITYEQKFQRDDAWLTANPDSKRRYQRKPKGNPTPQSVKASDDVSITYRIEADPDMGFWLSSSNKRGIDEFNIEYIDNGSGIIKTINGSFTPTGNEIATTTLKVITSILPAARDVFAGSKSTSKKPKELTWKPKEPTWKSLPPDSTYRFQQQVVVKKSVNVSQFAADIKATPGGAQVLAFSSTDLNLGAVAVPKVEVWVKSLPLSTKAQDFYKEVSAAYDNNFDQAPATGAVATQGLLLASAPTTPQAGNTIPIVRTSSSSAVSTSATAPTAAGPKSNSVDGVLYRTPMICDVLVKVNKPDIPAQYTFSTIANRTSFPQLGVVAVVPVIYSRRAGKQKVDIEFNTENGGIVKSSVVREKSKENILEESGKMTESLLKEIKKQNDKYSEFQRLKDGNDLLEEQIRKLENQKKLAGLSEAQQ